MHDLRDPCYIQIRPDVAVWMSLAETWLQKRFALDLPDKCPDWREALGLD